jgi:ParB family chromosome partitioning protein
LAGFRRFTCHEILGRKTIKAILCNDMTEQDAAILNLRENIFRKDLNILEEAKAIRKLLGLGMSDKAVAKEFKKSQPWVAIRVKLLLLPEDIQKVAATGLLTQAQIRDIYDLDTPEKQYAAIRNIKDAKARGEKVILHAKVKHESANVKRQRGRSEMFVMQGFIQDTIGNNFGTRCLAWAAGEISDKELFDEIRELADARGKFFNTPTISVANLAALRKI